MAREAHPAPVVPFALRHSTFDVPVSPPLVMGILNVTPDSFSDGGAYSDRGAAVDRALAMVEEGAAVIDIGPESTRPGARDVPADEQIRRALPVIESIRRHNREITLSIDTRSALVAKTALDAGADMVNDTSALGDDPAMADIVAASRASVVLMHRRGLPGDMQQGGGPQYDDVILEIRDFLKERRDHAVRCGIDRSRIVLDPGIGFGKRVEHNLQILRNVDRFVDLGQPVLIGASRKRFIGTILGIDDPKGRDAASLGCAVLAALAHVSIIRTHDVKATVDALRIVAAIAPPNRL